MPADEDRDPDGEGDPADGDGDGDGTGTETGTGTLGEDGDRSGSAVDGGVDGEPVDDGDTAGGSVGDGEIGGANDAGDSGDTFGVGVHVTEAELRFVVHVPSAIDSGWTDPEEFQLTVERVVWERLDRETVLRRIAAGTPAGETVSLGTVTLRPDGTVVDDSLSVPPEP